jgi:hypothetical protein
MSAWQYRCVSCGEVHDAPLRPEGTVFLRCVTTRVWAWHEPESFLAVAEPGLALRLARRAERARPAPRTVRTRAAAPRRGTSSARTQQRTAARRTSRASRKKA